MLCKVHSNFPFHAVFLFHEKIGLWHGGKETIMKKRPHIGEYERISDAQDFSK